MAFRVFAVCVLTLASAAQAQAQLINVQIGRRFAPVRRPYVTEGVIDQYGRQILPGPVFQLPQAQAAPWAQPPTVRDLPRLVIEIRVIQPGPTFAQGQPPPWETIQAQQPPPWAIPQAQGQPPPWAIPQAQPQLVCGPGG